MRISNIKVYPLALPMKQDFLISRGSVGNRQKGAPHVYVKITSDNGGVGWGEARPSHRWSYETLESVATSLNQYIRPALIGDNAEDLKAIHKKMDAQIAPGFGVGQPIAKAVIDMALFDPIGKQRKQPLAALWGGTGKDYINLTYLISTKDPEEAFGKAKQNKRVIRELTSRLD